MRVCEYLRSRSFLYHIFSRSCMLCALLGQDIRWAFTGPMVLWFIQQAVFREGLLVLVAEKLRKKIRMLLKMILRLFSHQITWWGNLRLFTHQITWWGNLWEHFPTKSLDEVIYESIFPPNHFLRYSMIAFSHQITWWGNLWEHFPTKSLVEVTYESIFPPNHLMR